jgi:pimeloyl-ACP methyl ester carboxylesterase
MPADPIDEIPTLPGIRQRTLNDVNGLSVRVLEAGYETHGRPAVLLLHGFPEIAYSWRKVMVPLADAGYHVIAPDQRGYGSTTGWDDRYDGDVASFRTHASRATRWASSRPWAIAPSQPSWATMSGQSSHPIARWSDRMSSAHW